MHKPNIKREVETVNRSSLKRIGYSLLLLTTVNKKCKFQISKYRTLRRQHTGERRESWLLISHAANMCLCQNKNTSLMRVYTKSMDVHKNKIYLSYYFPLATS